MYNKITEQLRVKLYFPRTKVKQYEKAMTREELWRDVTMLINSQDYPTMEFDGAEDNPMFHICINDDGVIVAEFECCDLAAWVDTGGKI